MFSITKSLKLAEGVSRRSSDGSLPYRHSWFRQIPWPSIKADLDLHKLEIFYWVAEHKSFSQAAELLSLRQPTISAHVQELKKRSAASCSIAYREKSASRR